MLYRFRGLEKHSSEFRRALVEMAGRLAVNPNHIAAVMQTESGFDHHVSNHWCRAQGRDRSQCAYGLIQFMPFVLRAYGVTVAELDAMSDVGQLEFVERFYRPHAGKLKSAGDAYMATFLPAFVGSHPRRVLGIGDGVTVCVDADKRLMLEVRDASVVGFELSGADQLGYGLRLGAVYEQNSGFDRNHDGVVTVGEVTATAERNLVEARARGCFLVTPLPLLPLEVSQEEHNANRDKWLMGDDDE